MIVQTLAVGDDDRLSPFEHIPAAANLQGAVYGLSQKQQDPLCSS